MTHLPCQSCGKLVHIDLLDSKPELTLWLRFLRFLRGQLFMLAYCGDHGHDFTVLECEECYGPGWCPL